MSSDDFTATGEEETDHIDGCGWVQGLEARRLVETYLRLSWGLRRRGFVERTVHRIGIVEAELRARNIDPDAIARVVDETRTGDQ